MIWPIKVRDRQFRVRLITAVCNFTYIFCSSYLHRFVSQSLQMSFSNTHISTSVPKGIRSMFCSPDMQGLQRHKLTEPLGFLHPCRATSKTHVPVQTRTHFFFKSISQLRIVLRPEPWIHRTSKWHQKHVRAIYCIYWTLQTFMETFIT